MDWLKAGSSHQPQFVLIEDTGVYWDRKVSYTPSRHTLNVTSRTTAIINRLIHRLACIFKPDFKLSSFPL